MEHIAATELDLNGIGICSVALERAVSFDSYAKNRGSGGFIVIDRVINSRIGAGMIQFALRRSHTCTSSP